MAALFRQLLVNVAAAAILGGISLQAVKEGPLHEMVRVAAGLMMTLALLVPLSRAPAVKMAFSSTLGEVQSAARRRKLGRQRDCRVHSGPRKRNGGQMQRFRTYGRG